jgi:hypothetical protein
MLSCTATLRSRAFAFACFGVALAAFGFSAKDEPALLANTSGAGRTDLDRDGLTDLQERVIGTLPYQADSDSDGFSDLEERARGADPLNPASVPEPAEYSVGSCASQEDGFVSVLSMIYVEGTQLDNVDLDLGFVFRGKKVRLSPTLQTYTRAFVYRAANPADTLAVIEIGLPENVVSRLKQVSMWNRISDTSSTAIDPFVSVLTLVDFSGVVMAVEPTVSRVANTGGGATGVVYRPLAPDDRIPSTWEGGEMCFQRTSAVGMSGVSVVHEVDAADCIPMDTYCSPTDCAAGVGTALALPDAAALAGG